MGVANDDVLVAGPDSARIVFVREGRSELMGADRQDPDIYGERALPELLRQRWAIRSTVPTAGGTYVVLARRVAEPGGAGEGASVRTIRAAPPHTSDDPPSSSTAGLG